VSTIRRYQQFFIDGQWVDPASPGSLEVVDPATEDVCAVIPGGAAADIDRAVEAAKRAFRHFGQSTMDERVAIIEAVIAAYENHYDDFAKAVQLEIGAPTRLAIDAHAASGLRHLKTGLEVLKSFQFRDSLDGSVIVREPIGVCGLITPWNWPLNQIACKVTPALAVGCTIVLKPSEVAPLSANVFATVMEEANVPPGVFNMVHGSGETAGTALSTHPDVDMLSFTGSTRAGSLVARNAAPTIKRVVQELGGKSPNILLDDVSLEAAVTRGVRQLFVNSGQSCDAPSRMLVPRALADEAARIAARVAQTVVVGDPKAEGTTMGPVVSETQFNRIQSLIQRGIDEGATLVCGGIGRPDGLHRGYFVKPTIFSNVINNMTIAREEIFGPVLCIIPYDSDAQAVEIANDTPYGLAGYIQGQNMARIMAIAGQLRAGNISINGKSGGLRTPFGGYKMSGNGRERGTHGFAEYLEIKVISGAEAS
jgi:aldehyde dehydrogenase (NAD+)